MRDSRDVIEQKGTALTALVVALGVVFALAVDRQDMLGQLSRDMFAAVRTIVLFVPFLVIALAVIEAPRAPFSRLIDILKTRSGGAASALVCLFSALPAFSTLKTNIPDVLPFWADPVLTAADEAIFFGTPWIMLHEIVPLWLGEVMVRAYSEWWFAYWLGTYLAVAFTAPSVLRARYILSFILTLFLMGVVTATAMASAGPIFMARMGGDPSFVGLEEALLGVPHGTSVITYADYLYRLYEAGRADIGSGISAFPSIHCAAVFLNALYFSAIHRAAGIVAWGFAGLIYVGSIYTGWHYAIDGAASLIGVLLIWRLSPSLLTRAGRLRPLRIGQGAAALPR